MTNISTGKLYKAALHSHLWKQKCKTNTPCRNELGRAIQGSQTCMQNLLWLFRWLIKRWNLLLVSLKCQAFASPNYRATNYAQHYYNNYILFLTKAKAWLNILKLIFFSLYFVMEFTAHKFPRVRIKTAFSLL